MSTAIEYKYQSVGRFVLMVCPDKGNIPCQRVACPYYKPATEPTPAGAILGPVGECSLYKQVSAYGKPE